MQGISLFKSKNITSLDDSLYVEAVETVKPRTALSASSPELNRILD
jgi:hypothetical protein